MKQLLFAIALLFSTAAGAQTIDMDGNGMFAEIEPVAIGWLSADFKISRVYVDPNSFAVNTTSGKGLVKYKWWLMYPDTAVNSSTWYRVNGPLGEGYVSGGIPSIDVTLRQSVLKIFEYVADSVGLDIRYKIK